MEFKILNDFERYTQKFPDLFSENIHISLCETLKLIHGVEDKYTKYSMLYMTLETLCECCRDLYSVQKNELLEIISIKMEMNLLETINLRLKKF